MTHGGDYVAILDDEISQRNQEESTKVGCEKCGSQVGELNQLKLKTVVP